MLLSQTIQKKNRSFLGLSAVNFAIVFIVNLFDLVFEWVVVGSNQEFLIYLQSLVAQNAS